MKNFLKTSIFLIFFSLVGHYFFSSSANAQVSPPFYGTYKLINPHSGKALDVTGNGTANGTNVEIWTDIGSVAQQWDIIQNLDGTFKLANPNSGRVLDVTGGGTGNGTNVEIWADIGSPAQKWSIIQNSNGTYKLINPNSSKALDVYGGGTANGTNVDIWQDNGHLSQQWNLDPIDPPNWDCRYDHCYGAMYWPNNVDGASTNVTIAPLTCTGCATTGYHYTNEMWLVTADEANWIEVGYGTGIWDTTINSNSLCNSDCYFYADNRPGASFYAKVLGTVPSADFGGKTGFTIDRQSSTVWQIIVVSNNTYYSPYSGPNTMVPGAIEIGSEFAGLSYSTGLSASRALFDDNSWRGVGSNTWNYQTNDGHLGISNKYPVISNWTGGEKPSQSSTGGQWYTDCPSSACF